MTTIKVRNNKIIISITRSVTTVPNNLEKGTSSYLLTTPQRVNSPIRGIAKLAKYPIITPIKLFPKEILYPIDAVSNCHRRARLT